MALEIAPKQLWVDKWLGSKTNEELLCLHERNKNLNEEQNVSKAKMFVELKELHDKCMLELPKRLRFMCPSKGMVGARARELKTLREADPSIEKADFGAPVKSKSILDL